MQLYIAYSLWSEIFLFFFISSISHGAHCYLPRGEVQTSLILFSLCIFQVQHYYRNVHAVVFTYDVTKISSFENLPQWIEECNHHKLTTDIPRILVGNKCDMKDRIAVSTNTAQRFADSHNMPLFETSAKDDGESDHVESIFLTLAHKLKNAKSMMPPDLAGYGYVGSKTVGLHESAETRAYDNSVEEQNRDGCAC